MLSFSHRRENGTSDLWLPAKARSYAAQCEEGRARGKELVAMIRDTQEPTLLGHVIARITQIGQHGGLEIGFYQVVAEHLM